jgi:hypothetical protein
VEVSEAMAMDATNPYTFIRFGAMDATNPYKSIGFEAMDATKPCKFIGFGALGAPGCESRASPNLR